MGNRGSVMIRIMIVDDQSLIRDGYSDASYEWC